MEISASDHDRERAFRRARRHTLIVRVFRIVLPVMAVGSVAYFGGSLYLASRLKSRNVSVAKVSIDPTNLNMQDPRYGGFAKDGAEYKVHALRAITDLKMSGPVRLEVIDGNIKQLNGVVTNLKANWGTYDQKTDVLELYEKIDIDGSDGMRARLTRATVFNKESRITSNEPVWAENATSTIKANSMKIDNKAHTANFVDAVEVTLRSNQPTKAPDPTKPKPQAFGLDANSGQPVVVTSRTLDVNDLTKVALFRENVVARQGEAELQAPELDVIYEGKMAGSGASPAPAPAPAASATPEQQQKLKFIRARGGVIMTSKGDRADSQTLDYDGETEHTTLTGNVVMTQQPDRRITADNVLLDQKADTALLTGTVNVDQGRNIMRGTRLAIDRKNGTARLTSPAQPGRAAGRIYTLFYQNQAGKPGTPQKPEQKADASSSDNPLGASFKTDPNQPIEVESVTLDVNDKRHMAIYTGAVIAKQGNFTVKTDEMTAHYTGETGLLANAQPAQPAPRDKAKGIAGAGNAEIKRIEARRHVVVVGSDGQQATGDWADFDVKANNVIMGGNVLITQGKQVVHAGDGKRLLIDLTTGEARIEDDPNAAAQAHKSGPQVSSAFSTSVAADPKAKITNPTGCPPGAICKSGRSYAIFYQNDVKAKVKDKAGEAAKAIPPEAAKAATEAATEAAKTVTKRLPKASEWTSSTDGAKP
ncbi:MAG: LPS export ABC transporter periplasmic protein LptC [Proteobacteria bacterium]|nr:LPS export ABC transporter periplasmic protein LptC [Pseudomonadota bacterium]